MKQTIKWEWIYLILAIFSMATFSCSCSCSEDRSATFTGPLVDKRYDERYHRYIVLINDTQLNKIITVFTTADVYYKSSVSSTLSFVLTEGELITYGNGMEDATQMMDRKVLKPAKEYLKKQ